MLIGLSLSMCIKDIINGKINIIDVSFIISGTEIINEKDWENMLTFYSNIYWKKM